MILTALLLAHAAAPRPPRLDHGWAVATRYAKSSTADCPGLGRISAEFELDRKGIRVVRVRGLGRVSNAADRARIDAMFGRLRGLVDVTVDCWGREAGFVAVSGIEPVDRGTQNVTIRFLWRRGGAERLSPNALYPSVIAASVMPGLTRHP